MLIFKMNLILIFNFGATIYNNRLTAEILMFWWNLVNLALTYI